MSDQLKSFLDWFEGFAENIKKQPTPAQWSRIKARISDLQKIQAELRARAPEPPISIEDGMPAVTTPKPKKSMQKPTNARQWKAQYRAFLMENGVDEDSAKDFADVVQVDLEMDPEQVARQDLGPMGMNGSA